MTGMTRMNKYTPLYNVTIQRPGTPEQKLAVVKAIRATGTVGNWFQELAEFYQPDVEAIKAAIPAQLIKSFNRSGGKQFWYIGNTQDAETKLYSVKGKLLATVRCFGYIYTGEQSDE